MSKAPIAKQQKSEGSLFTFFSKSIGDLSDTRWRELIEEQDYDTLILEIREELLGRVADECYQKHLRCQVSKLLIECTHRAFQQIIPLHFYTYDDSHKLASSQESWIPDDEPVICKPDSWAKGNIPYNVDDIPKNKFQQTDNVSSEYNLIKCDEYPSSNVFDTYSNKCELEDGDGAEFLGSVDEVTLETDEPELAFQSSVQFSNNDVALSKELLPSIQDIAIVRSMQHNRVASENTFYRIMKASKTSSINLQTTARAKKSNPPTWTVVDEIRDDLKPRTFGSGSNRYLQMRRECLATVDRKPTCKKS